MCNLAYARWQVGVHYLEKRFRQSMLSHEGLESNDVKELVARRAVAQMERADLEDKHLNLMEENLVRNYLTVSLKSSHYIPTHHSY